MEAPLCSIAWFCIGVDCTESEFDGSGALGFGALPNEQPQIVYCGPVVSVMPSGAPDTPRIRKLGSFAQAELTSAGVRTIVRAAAVIACEFAWRLGDWPGFVHFVNFGSLVAPRCTVTASYALCSCPFDGIAVGPAVDPLLGSAAFAGVIVVPGACSISAPGVPPFAKSGCPGVPSIDPDVGTGLANRGFAADIGARCALTPVFVELAD